MDPNRPTGESDQSTNPPADPALGTHPAHPPHPVHPVLDDGPSALPAAEVDGAPAISADRNLEVFAPGTFADFALRTSVMKGIEACGFVHPTVTQAQFIPPILAGMDVLGQAKTGSGKTAAFGLPLLNNLALGVPFQALILAPTRELAIQITGEIEDLGRFTPIRSTTVYGGQAISSQADKLAKGPPIIVGTPGRIMDMLERGHFHFNNITHVVLDEVDRMLDIGFRDDIRRILSQVPNKNRQTVFVSATISKEIEALGRRYMREGQVEKIVVASGSLTVNAVQQFYLPVNAWDKKRLLLHLLRHEEPALTIVFCRLKRHVDEIARGLTQRGIDAHAIHGDMTQGRRNMTMDKLRGGSLSVLVASDLASRGIDVDDISHVINFDLPEDPEVYVHRIGRTARAGKGGVAWSLVTPDQGELLTNIEILINREVPRLDYPDFQGTDTAPDGYRAPLSGGRREGGLTIISSPGGPSAPPPPPPPPRPQNRTEASKIVLPVANEASPDPSKFPGGVMPTKLPPKLLSRGVKRGKR